VKYIKEIDGLRFFAIFFVLMHHFASIFSKFIDWGYYGVDLFFVISGFLISSILLNTKGENFSSIYKNFIGRRVLRIFPLYYCTIILLFIIGAPGAKTYIFSLLSYTFNYKFPFIPVSEPNVIGHFWSLCVEEQFYLFWPLMLIPLRKKSALLLLITIIIIIFAYSQITFNWIKPLSVYNYSGLPTRMGSLGLGALGAILEKYYTLPKSWFKSLWIEILAFALLTFALIFSIQVILGLCSLFLILKTAKKGFCIPLINNFLSNKAVIYIGSISYGIYVFHIPVGYFFAAGIFDHYWNLINFNALGIFKILKWHSWILKFPLYSGLSIGVASLSYKYFEKPILQLKDKYFKY
jgi:peptidoglycan/LPS O-acetylase OafA/YrhL